ncbi:hypothetical protein [Persicirhabdus sediminis]|uniref:DUF4114 domain-containing protein n=1 Tax=Persicirhabdus sediminis TaxID=454144 RepID=A0A8J7MCK4_9BACT|nr:hypothetical protein [Persicirhabdus sediminis]MBK1790581.1 hypothetical protein [Persicirhabdus sediminis]
MKNRLTIAMLAMLVGVSVAEEDKPVGSLWVTGLTAYSEVRSGSHVQLNWEVSYAQTEDIGAEITEEDVLLPVESSTMTVWAIGAGYWGGNNYVLLQCKVAGETYQLFDAKAKNFKTNGNKPLFTKEVIDGEEIHFGMQGVSNQSGNYYRWTGTDRSNPDHSFIALRNGDSFPNYTPMGNDGDVESYLKPYLDTETNTVVLGEKDVIYIAELDRRYTYEQSGNPDDKGYDMQDMVFLVSFQ